MKHFLFIQFFVLHAIKIRLTAEEDWRYGVTSWARKTFPLSDALTTDQARIFGGEIAQPNEFPFMVGIRVENRPLVFCGGVIISAFHVLTAAHCTDSRFNRRFKIVVGGHDVYNPKNSRAVELKVKRVVQHEFFDQRGELENDIAVLVTEKIPFNNFIQPARFPNKKLNLIGQKVKVLGWGKLSSNGPYSDVLRKVSLEVVDLQECNAYFSGIDIKQSAQICTKMPQADSCQGDSGGPVIWKNPATNKYTVVGIISFGDLCSQEKAPAVNTDVYYYRDWVKKKIGNER